MLNPLRFSEECKKTNKEQLDNIVKYRTPHYHKNMPIILLWSEKSGCTSLVKWFFYQIGELDQAIKYHPWIHKYEFDVYKKKKEYREDVFNQLLNKEKDVIKLVRNPYKRVISSFFTLLQDKDRYKKEWEDIRELVYKNRHSEEGISFKDFLYYLKNTGTNVEVLNGHLAQQYIEGEELIVDKYIYLENFDEHIQEIEEYYGLEASPLSLITKSKHHRTSLMNLTGNFADTKFKKLEKQLPTYKSFYDKEAVGLVEDIFKKDIECYNYKIPF